jgi:hypothetical protein
LSELSEVVDGFSFVVLSIHATATREGTGVTEAKFIVVRIVLPISLELATR